MIVFILLKLIIMLLEVFGKFFKFNFIILIYFILVMFRRVFLIEDVYKSILVILKYLIELSYI